MIAGGRVVAVDVLDEKLDAGAKLGARTLLRSVATKEDLVEVIEALGGV